MPFAWRAREAFKGESCVAEGLFHCSFAAVGKEYGAGCTAGGNGAEYCLIPQFRLGGRWKSVIQHKCRLGGVFCFPIVFLRKSGNICTGFVQNECLFTYGNVFFPGTIMVRGCQGIGKRFVGSETCLLRNYVVIVKLLYFRDRYWVFLYSIVADMREREAL